MIARIKTNLIKYFFFGNSITDDGYLRLAYLVGRFIVFLPLSLCATLVLGIYSIFRPVKIFMLPCALAKVSLVIYSLEPQLRIETHYDQFSGRRPALLFAVLDCKSPNRALTRIYGRVLPFLDDEKFFTRGIIRYTLPLFRISRRELPAKQTYRLEIWAKQPPVNAFTQGEIKNGRALESKLLTKGNKGFICIGLPHKLYYDNLIKNKIRTPSPIDIQSSNPTWSNYIPSTTTLLDAGYGVIRVGHINDASFEKVDNPGIIDYASNHRSEFGDVWLLANCKFVIAGGGTGLYWIASAFDVPTLITDKYTLINTSNGPSDLFTPQLAWSRSEKKLMPFSWIIAQGEGWGHKRSLIEGDIEIVKNTADEITEVVLEMNQRLDGTWIESEEDRELQARFSALRASIPKWQVQPGVRIGAGFLRRYKHLL